MKGAFFQKPLEMSLSIDGESWRQGDKIQGRLVIKNRGSEPVPASDVRVHLVLGQLRKVRQKAAGAFEALSSPARGAAATIGAGGEATLDWSFELDRNAPITDVSESPFVLYGRGDALETLGQLQLPVSPHALVQEILEILNVQLRFVVKACKNRKSGVEAKLVPPEGARGFAAMEHLMASFRFRGEELVIGYVFHMKKLEATAVSYDVKKGKSELEQTVSPSQYRTASGRINHESLESLIREALKAGESKIIA